MILSIESSCDDSSIAVTDINSKQLVFHKKISQEIDHSVYGGVVPELAARLHAEALPKILEEASIYFNQLKAIAVTTHPGLSVTLTEGVVMAKALSIFLKIPLIGVNHLKGHIYSLFINKEAVFPMTILLVSGGHTQVIEAKSHDNMKIAMSTGDDSFGESFDKVSKMLHLGYPGGPIIEAMAKNGNANCFAFPVPLYNSNRLEFSYSGLKNAVKIKIDSIDELKENDVFNICASFQKTAISHVSHKLKQYFKTTKPQNFAIVGGASANMSLRTELEILAKNFLAPMFVADLNYCSDNAAMIGRCAIEEYKNNNFTDIHNLTIKTNAEGCL